jgi:integrase
MDRPGGKFERAIGIPLNESAVEVLRRRIGHDNAHVFTYEGKAWRGVRPKRGSRRWHGPGIERSFRWHDLRHTWASCHVQNGTPLQEPMELGSWANYMMVSNTRT